MVARIATLSRNRRPHINPLYFVYLDGRIYLGTSDRTLAALNVKANPRVTILFNVERKPTDRRVLRIRGRAKVCKNSGLRLSYLRRDARKYFMSWGGIRNTLAHARLLPLLRRYLSSGEKGQHCLLEVIPEQAELLTAPEKILRR
jgi:hypothetical protein